MYEISNFLLSIYEEAQQSKTVDFVNFAMDGVKKMLGFNSGAIASLGIAANGELQVKGGFAYNCSGEEKIKARRELGITERYVPGRGLLGWDPILEKGFRYRNRAHAIDCNTLIEPRVAEYTRKTSVSHALLIASNSFADGGFRTLSLWRERSQEEYIAEDVSLASFILPHVFMAQTINTKLLEKYTPDCDKSYPEPIICAMNGFMNFINEDAYNFLKKKFPNWMPPFLPKVIFDGLRDNSLRRFDGAEFFVKAILVDRVILVYIFERFISNKLTKTEIMVAEFLAQDATYKDIASQLGTSPATVRNQAASIYKKLNITKKSEIRAALLFGAH